MSRSAVRVRSSALYFPANTVKSRMHCSHHRELGSSRAAVDFIPRPRPSCRRRDFPCWASSASSDQESWLCWRDPDGDEPVWGGHRVPRVGWRTCARGRVMRRLPPMKKPSCPRRRQARHNDHRPLNHQRRGDPGSATRDGAGGAGQHARGRYRERSSSRSSSWSCA
jgi:hypothetical protein